MFVNKSLSYRVLIVATGIWKPNIPEMKGIEYTLGYESMSLSPEDYEGKSVLILGRFEKLFFECVYMRACNDCKLVSVNTVTN